jgi:hypothetical protein
MMMRLLRSLIADMRMPGRFVPLPPQATSQPSHVRSELTETLHALVDRCTLCDVVGALAEVAQEKGMQSDDRAISAAWIRAAARLRDVADQTGSMPDPL